MERSIEWRWVRGHAGDIMYERADVLATRAREAAVAAARRGDGS